MSESDTKCWIFGDEAGRMGVDRFFSIGVIGTRHPKEVIKTLREIRDRTEYHDEVSYKSSNQKRVLCAIRWMDWFFSGQKLAHFKIIIKDSEEFDVGYYKGNKYDAGAAQLAYCESYREVLNNFACYSDDQKGFVYSQIGLQRMSIEKHLAGKVKGLTTDQCFSRSSREKTKDGSQFTGTAEILQLCDILTSSTRGLCCSLFGEEVDTWDKNILRKNIHYYVSNIKDNLSANRNVYFPRFTPFDSQTFAIYKWTGGKKKMPTRS